jgi:hypothetical protein
MVWKTARRTTLAAFAIAILAVGWQLATDGGGTVMARIERAYHDHD